MNLLDLTQFVSLLFCGHEGVFRSFIWVFFV